MKKIATEIKANGNEAGLLSALEHVRNDLAALKKREDLIKADILEVFGEQIEDAHKGKGDPFGVVSFQHEGAKVSFTTPKKVTWDQEKLAALHKLGAPVSVEYNIPEAVFKAQDQAGQDILMPARMVAPGSVAIKIERT